MGFLLPTGYDLAVANAYAKANESAIALLFALMLLKPREGMAVLISDAPGRAGPPLCDARLGNGLRRPPIHTPPKGLFARLL